MAKEENKKAVEEAAEAKINNPDRPEKPVANKAVDLETISHNWQAGSPAIDLSYVGSENAVNVIALEQAAKAEENTKGPQPYVKKQKTVLDEAEYERRTEMDVADPRYINPSLDHVKVK